MIKELVLNKRVISLNRVYLRYIRLEFLVEVSDKTTQYTIILELPIDV